MEVYYYSQRGAPGNDSGVLFSREWKNLMMYHFFDLYEP